MSAEQQEITGTGDRLVRRRGDTVWIAEAVLDRRIEEFGQRVRVKPEQAEIVRAGFERALESGEPQDTEHFLISPNGARNWYLTRIAALRGLIAAQGARAVPVIQTVLTGNDMRTSLLALVCRNR